MSGILSKPPAVLFNHVSIQRGSLVILDDLNVSIPEGSCTALIGPNGAGKTSLLMALLGELPYKGSISFADAGRKQASPRIGYVPQKLAFDRSMPLTVVECLAMGIQRRPLWLGIKDETMEKIDGVLDIIKAAHLRSRKIGDLSGGELQRILLAIAILQSPSLLILDELSAGVDVQGGRLFCSLLDDLRCKYGFTLLVVSHNLGMVACHATHVIALKRRCVAEGRPTDVLTPAILTELFGIHMGSVNLFTAENLQEGHHDV